jgi:hypothetical protein
MATTVNVTLEPSSKKVMVGDEFTLDLWVRSSAPTTFDNVCLYLSYDTTKLVLLGTDAPAHLGYIFGRIPVYSWQSSSPVSSDYELPALYFKAIGDADSTSITMTGPVVDRYGVSHQAVNLGCTTDLTGTLTGSSIQIVEPPPVPGDSQVPEPLTVIAVFLAFSGLGIYLRSRTKTAAM